MKQHFVHKSCVTISIIMNSITQVSHALCDSQGTQVTLWSRAVKHYIYVHVLSVQVTHSKPALVYPPGRLRTKPLSDEYR